MAGFSEVLHGIATRVPETLLVMVMGTDGIPVDKLVVRADARLEGVAAEYTTLLRASLAAANDTGLGDLEEVAVVTEGMTCLMVSITPEYFLFAALGPGAFVGRARYAMRVVSVALAREFE